MFECYFTMFSESRLWECRVFMLFGDRVLTTVYGNIIFSRSKMHAWHKSLVFFPLIFHLFLLLEAL